MQPISYPLNPDILLQFWNSFRETGQVTAVQSHEPDPEVIRSWQRCAPRADPLGAPRISVLQPLVLAAILKTHANLITLATPLMEDIYQFIEGCDSAILLTDGAACVLAVDGDPTSVTRLEENNYGQGCYWSEGLLGTNAFGLALMTAMPVQVVGAEHYFSAHHNMASSAAPIHDVNGRIIGIIGIVEAAKSATSYALSLVMAAARAISSQMQANWYLEEAINRLTEVNTIMEAIDEGVLAWDGGTGQINHINPQAADMLHLERTAVLGQPISEVLTMPTVMVEAVENNTILRDIEAQFIVNGENVHLLVSLRPVLSGDDRPIGQISMLRPIERVRALIHQQVGTQAMLLLDDVSANSAMMRAVMRQATTASRGTAPVLLRGEGGGGQKPSGTGDSQRQ